MAAFIINIQLFHDSEKAQGSSDDEIISERQLIYIEIRLLSRRVGASSAMKRKWAWRLQIMGGGANDLFAQAKVQMGGLRFFATSKTPLLIGRA